MQDTTLEIGNRTQVSVTTVNFVSILSFPAVHQSDRSLTPLLLTVTSSASAAAFCLFLKRTVPNAWRHAWNKKTFNFVEHRPALHSLLVMQYFN
jgi:hypothetical protein